MGDRCHIAAEPFSEHHPWIESWMIGGLPHQHLIGKVTCGSLEVQDHSATFELEQELDGRSDPSSLHLSPEFLTSHGGELIIFPVGLMLFENWSRDMHHDHRVERYYGTGPMRPSPSPKLGLQ